MEQESLTAESLRKLTVAKLKILCKERKLPGYSKLQKNAIIQKLLSVQESADSSSNVTTADGLESLLATASDLRTQGAPPQLLEEDIQHVGSAIHSLPSSALHPLTVPTASGLTGTVPNLLVDDLDSPACSTKRPPHALPPGFPSKKSRLSDSKQALSDITTFSISTEQTSKSGATERSGSNQATRFAGIPVSLGIRHSLLRHPSKSGDVNKNLPPSSSSDLSSTVRSRPRRFVPLVPTVFPNADLETTVIDTTVPPTQTLYYLDAPLDTSPNTLGPISLPPLLSQRRLADRLSVILSLVPDEDLNTLSKTSRVLRYAVYLSAVHRLPREFQGARLSSLMNKYSSKTTNMWPYLRQRQRERKTRIDTYTQSFLGKALGHGPNKIEPTLWSSPHNAKQASIAVRFLLTRFFFAISVGTPIDDTEVVTNTEEIIEGEIWKITTRSAKCSKAFYVLEATCEVIGRPPQNHLDVSTESDTLRADWSEYIWRLNQQHLPRHSLVDHIVWTNHEEFLRGISRLWLNKISKEGEVGAAKRLVAERYILACVVGNSISGKWMSSTEMAQAFDGLSARVDYRIQLPRINMYIPAHHHVESLHFSSTDRQPLHPAIAVVQTPSRVYYILRDNGMQIGCEEDGVSTVWMELLGCDSVGKEIP